MFLCLFIFSLLRVSLASDCQNPLGKSLDIDLLDSPSTGTGECVEQLLNGATCCSQDHHDTSKEFMEQLYEKYKESADYFVQIVQETDEMLSLIYAASKRKLEAAGLDTSSDSSGSTGILDPEIRSITNSQWTSLKSEFPVYMQTCHQQLFKMGSALRCYACDPEYSSYIEQFGKGDSLMVTLDDSTCSSLASSCQEMALVVYYFMIKLNAGAESIVSTEEKLGNMNVTFSEMEEEVWTDFREGYAPADTFEEIDLKFEPYFLDCSFGGDIKDMEDFIEEQTGILGPSVYNLMLQPKNLQTVFDEVKNWINEKESVFSVQGNEENSEASRRLGEVLRFVSKKSSNKRRRLGSSDRIYFYFSENENGKAVDLLGASEILGQTPIIEALFKRILEFSVISSGFILVFLII